MSIYTGRKNPHFINTLTLLICILQYYGVMQLHKVFMGFGAALPQYIIFIIHNNWVSIFLGLLAIGISVLYLSNKIAKLKAYRLSRNLFFIVTLYTVCVLFFFDSMIWGCCDDVI